MPRSSTLSADADPAYTEQGDPVAIDDEISVTDADHAQLTGATVTIGAGRGTGDTLSFTPVDGITGEFTADDGTLALTGAASKADYRTVLRSVRYANDLDDPSAAKRTISIVVSDGIETSGAVTRDVTFTAVNDAPVAGLSGDADPSYTEQGDPVAPRRRPHGHRRRRRLASRARPSPSAPGAAAATR